VALQQSEANDRVFEMLGMSASTLYKTCFSAQKKLTDVIEMTHSERMTYFQQLFETERAEKLRGMLLDYQNKLPNYVDRLVAIKETEERIAQLQESRVKVDELLTAYKASYEEHTKAAPTYEAILAKPSQTQLAHSIALVQAKVDDATAKYNSFCANILTAPVAPTRELATDALDKVRKKQQFLHLQKDVATQTAEVDKWKSVEQEKAPVKPTEPAFPEDQEISSLTALYRLAKEGVCPTCKRPHVLTRSVEDITVELTTLKKAVEDRKLSYNREMTDYTSKVGAYTVKLNNFNLAKNRLNTAKLQIIIPLPASITGL
jgi:DNA repair exonuclease SbcCD ATPase subunit